MQEYWVNVYEDNIVGGRLPYKPDAEMWSEVWLKSRGIKTIYRIHVKMKPNPVQDALVKLVKDNYELPSPKYEVDWGFNSI